MGMNMTWMKRGIASAALPMLLPAAAKARMSAESVQVHFASLARQAGK